MARQLLIAHLKVFGDRLMVGTFRLMTDICTREDARDAITFKKGMISENIFYCMLGGRRRGGAVTSPELVSALLPLPYTYFLPFLFFVLF